MKELMIIKVKKLRKICLRYLGDILLFLAALLVCFPILLLLTGVVKSTGELREGLAPILSKGEGGIHWNLLPLYPTGEHLLDILFFKPQFHVVFWNSMKITACILAGQLFLASPMAWGFARFSFPGKKVLFTLYVILMLMPFQVMMLPSYLILNGMNLLDTHLAVILPAMCSTLPVFLMYQGFASIPKECIEAAQIDGADNWQVFFYLGVPLGSGGILSAMVLGYLEYWNMLEQPMTFLRTSAKYPLSLFLPQISMEQAGVGLAASLFMLIPAMFIFFAGQDYLEQGIAVSGLKG